MFLIDQALTLTALAAIPIWWKLRSPEAALLVAWIAAVAIALLGYQYRNASYLLPIVVAFSIVATPVARSRVFTLAVLPVVLLEKLYAGEEPRGLPFQTGSTFTSAPPLERYRESNRGNELIIVSPDDEFYSSVLPLPQVRYCYLVSEAPECQYPLDFQHLGIVLTASQFETLDTLRPTFARRLSEWGGPFHRNRPSIGWLSGAHGDGRRRGNRIP